MRFFVQTTRGHAVITGRRNFDAMGKPLPGRRNLVVSRDPTLALNGAEVVTSVPEALRMAELGGETEAFVIGGAQIYALAFPFAHRFYRTRVLAEVDGDVFFPELDLSDFDGETLLHVSADPENEHPCVIESLTRRTSPRPYV
jgi:dihydrofolate reductase